MISHGCLHFIDGDSDYDRGKEREKKRRKQRIHKYMVLCTAEIEHREKSQGCTKSAIDLISASDCTAFFYLHSANGHEVTKRKRLAPAAPRERDDEEEEEEDGGKEEGY